MSQLGELRTIPAVFHFSTILHIKVFYGKIQIPENPQIHGIRLQKVDIAAEYLKF